MRNTSLLAILLLSAPISGLSQQTVGLFTHTGGSNDSGYVLFAPQNKTTYLIDKCGKLVHSWTSTHPPNSSVYLMEDGSLLHSGFVHEIDKSAGGLIERIAWDGTLTWTYVVNDSVNRQHHDFAPLPNGNVIILARDVRLKSDAIANGRDTSSGAPDSLLSEQLIEVRPIGPDSGEVVWRWRVWDHLVQDNDPEARNYGNITSHPELINLNYTTGSLTADDWLHANAVSYNAALDQVMISCYNMGEFWVVDHSTTTLEAASHKGGRQDNGGDILYRWGNPAAYKRGTPTDQKLFGLHSPDWIPEGYPHAGHILVFNNGARRPGGFYSSIDIIAPPVVGSGAYAAPTGAYLPAAQEWIYTDTPPSSFMSNTVGGAQMLANGNVLICNGANGKFFEIDSSDHNKVWEYTNPVDATGPVAQDSIVKTKTIFRCNFYPSSFPAFAGRTLTPGAPIELNPRPYDCTLNVRSAVDDQRQAKVVDLLTLYPNPTAGDIVLDGVRDSDHIAIQTASGFSILEQAGGTPINAASLPSGVYRVIVNGRGGVRSKMVTVLR